MKLIKKTLAGIASLLLLGQGLHAATVSYSNTKAFDSNYSTLTLSQFNTSLGTLTGVTIEINYSTLQGSFTVTNNYPSDVLVSGYTSAVSIKQVGSLGFTQQNASSVDGPSTSPDWNTTSIPYNHTQIFDISSGQNLFLNYSQVISAGSFSAYKGTGTVGFQGKDVTSLTTTGGTFGQDVTAATAATQMTVTYTYTAVPEPSTVGLLLGAGSLGLVAVIRRRRAAAKA